MDNENSRNEATRNTVREKYGNIAAGPEGECCASQTSCCGTSGPDELAKGVGYSDEELADLPSDKRLADYIVSLKINARHPE